MTDKEIEVIIKPIFTKMFDDDFSACKYGIECYKKGMEYQGIKELAIENDNLIKQVRTLKAQVEKMKCCQNCDYFKQDEYNNCHFYCALRCGLECANNKSYRMWKLKEN